MRTLLLIIPLLCIDLKGSCQLIVSANSGYGTYNLSEVKSLQQQIAASYPVVPRTGPSFPSYWFFDVNAKWVFKSHFLFGGSFASGSTGGRVYYSDYSGSIGSDQLLSFHSYQLTVGFHQRFFNGHLVLEGDLRPGITVTDLNWKSSIELGTYSQTDNREFKSNNFVMQPTLTLGGRFGIIGIQGFAGYNFTVAAGRLYDVTSASYVQQRNGEPVHADWSGLRMGGGFSLYMNDKKTKDDAEQNSLTAMGVGLGLDYGGIGFNVITYPGKYIGMFCGVGYALAGVGSNAGIKIRTRPISAPETSFYFSGMYGYNAAVAVSSNSDYTRLFYGPTLGAGVDFSKRTNGYWSLGILLPIRSGEVDQYINSLKNSGIKFGNNLTPVTLSIGYRFQK